MSEQTRTDRRAARVRGIATEKRAQRALQDNGWMTYRAMPGGRRFMEKDIFSCIDIVAKKEGEPTLWVQVTAAKAFTHKFEEMYMVPWGPGDRVELWHWQGTGKRGRGGFFEVISIHPHQEEARSTLAHSSNGLYTDMTSPSIPQGKETE